MIYTYGVVDFDNALNSNKSRDYSSSNKQYHHVDMAHHLFQNYAAYNMMSYFTTSRSKFTISRSKLTISRSKLNYRKNRKWLQQVERIGYSRSFASLSG